MPTERSITLSPEIAFDPEALEKYFADTFQADDPGIHIVIKKRSIDARSRRAKVHLLLQLYSGETPPERSPLPDSQVGSADSVVIVGAGPAGLFAAVELIALGVKPIILERGKDVQSRRRDLAAINKDHEVNPNSNYCFGEGGAGTYSDGKLYTRSKKRGDVERFLELLVNFGAKEEILYEAHPHIGTNKLPALIANVRNYILQAGGEIHFDTSVKDLVLSADKASIKGVVTQHGDQIDGIGVILATGHSARDIFELLDRKGVTIEQKPFALGLRVEHPQSLIDAGQYHQKSRGLFLPPAAYSMATQTIIKDQKRGVFSFCMCPGGFIVPSATSPGEVVVNGMSPSRRDGKFANSGIVVAIENEDIKAQSALANMVFQKGVEQKACEVAGGNQTAPAQRLIDFVEGKHSAQLPECSYQPGITSADLKEVLPEQLLSRLRYGFKEFGKKMKGYLTNEAVLVGVESRTSSPVRIPRDSNSLEHVSVQRLFPCGEGAGYAGGIVSAALDGQNCARAVVRLYHKN